MMEKYPAGRFIILSGIGMLVVTIFVSIGWNPLERMVGEKIVPYLVFALIGVVLLAMISCYKNLKPSTTVIIGTIGWIATFVLLYIHYSEQKY
jgi:hypothetical protein